MPVLQGLDREARGVGSRWRWRCRRGLTLAGCSPPPVAMYGAPPPTAEPKSPAPVDTVSAKPVDSPPMVPAYGMPPPPPPTPTASAEAARHADERAGACVWDAAADEAAEVS